MAKFLDHQVSRALLKDVPTHQQDVVMEFIQDSKIDVLRPDCHPREVALKCLVYLIEECGMSIQDSKDLSDKIQANVESYNSPRLISLYDSDELLSKIAPKKSKKCSKVKEKMYSLLCKEKDCLDKMSVEELRQYLRSASDGDDVWGEIVEGVLQSFSNTKIYYLDPKLFKVRIQVLPPGKKRVFYCIDIRHPIRQEVPVHVKDDLHPLKYPVRLLPSPLRPQFDHGDYILQCSNMSTIGVYLLSFASKTVAASKINKSTLGFDLFSHIASCKVQDILLPCTLDTHFEQYQFPDKVSDSNAIRSSVREWMQMSKELFGQKWDSLNVDDRADRGIVMAVYESTQVANKSDEPFIEPILARTSVHTYEPTKNLLLIKYLELQLEKLPWSFTTSSTTCSSTTCTHNYSRFSCSAEDFAWFVNPKYFMKDSSVSYDEASTVSGACATVTDSYTEDFDLTAASIECKVNFKESDVSQLLANMNKTAADIAYISIHNKVLFRKINVYGLLIDYGSKSLQKLFLLTMDFDTACCIVLEALDVESLSITDVLEKTTQMLVPRAT